jgi:hypothetical protein
MKKSLKKLTLCRETLQVLDGQLQTVAGGNPSTACNTIYPCTSVDVVCRPTTGCPTGDYVCT